MEKYQTIKFETKDQVATVWLNRPEVHNAFNEVMISEVIDVFENINTLEEIRVVVIRSNGKSFCAGADLNWMRNVAKYSYEENYNESLNVSKCFYRIYTCNKPTIAVVHGAAIGGANGFITACDFAYAEDEAVFSLSEVKIGIIPACVSPYVVKRVGEYAAKELMITGRRINGKEAEAVHLVNGAIKKDELEDYVNSIIKIIISGGPNAISKCKDLIFNVSNKLTLEIAGEYTAKMIADIRSSDEGQEGMAAFLEKRKPRWAK
ncbi:MAG: enoyl-CoA hydratase/isomerase family protein [Ignavibacteria bacterium]|nr:enoyl-CoA hydratase/isomerase family protein [Ignavibacteria bacterium]